VWRGARRTARRPAGSSVHRTPASGRGCRRRSADRRPPRIECEQDPDRADAQLLHVGVARALHGVDERPPEPGPALLEHAHRGVGLAAAERDALAASAALRGRGGRVTRQTAAELARLVDPIEDVLAFVAPRAQWWGRLPAGSALLHAMHTEQQAFWAFDRERW